MPKWLPRRHTILKRIDAKRTLTSLANFAARRRPAGRRMPSACSTAPCPIRACCCAAADGEVLACAQAAIEADLVGLYDVFTAPSSRGQGLSRRLCAHLLARAREQGARVAYLQVDAANHAARAVYRRLGFADGYAYHYRRAARAPTC